jgi:phosphate transport system substrate-binding protein
MKASLKRMDNEMAVSPIVATLVLIVVAVVGAVAVGTIMGTFSSDVSKQANAGNAAGASQTEIIVAGSTTIDPVTQAVAKLYSGINPGVKISSQATGSGAGFQAVTLGVADIGAMSEPLKTTQLNQNPNAIVYRIGSGAVAVITNKATPGVTDITVPVPVADLKNLFADPPVAGGAIKAAAIPVTRSDSSGTADTFYGSYLGSTVLKSFSSVGQAQSGNAALVQYVGSNANTIGFADYGYIATRSDVVMLPLNDGFKAYPTYGSSNTKSYENLTAVAQTEYRNNVEKIQSVGQSSVTQYNLSLIHPLNYVTNGNPTTLCGSFIDFARSGAAAQGFIDTNTFPLSKIF